MRTFWMKTVAVVLVVAFYHLAQVPVSAAQQGVQEGRDDGTQNTLSQFGLGAASFFLTVPYSASKVALAALGGIWGGLEYVLGEEEAAKEVWDTSVRGTYVITPEHLKGNKSIRFLGIPQEPEGEPLAQAP